jgi:hypothetical protein
MRKGSAFQSVVLVEELSGRKDAHQERSDYFIIRISMSFLSFSESHIGL